MNQPSEFENEYFDTTNSDHHNIYNTGYSQEEKFENLLHYNTDHSDNTVNKLPPSYQFSPSYKQTPPVPLQTESLNEDEEEVEEVDQYPSPPLSVLPLRPVPAPPQQQDATDLDISRSRDWGNLLDEYTDRSSVFTDKISHRVTRRSGRPPVTSSGIRVLRSDVLEANERIHQLMSKLRTILSHQAGIECSFLYDDDADRVGEGSASRSRSIVTLASDIVTNLRQRPEFIVMAMATTNKSSSSAAAMVQIAFTALHRLLHPFSTDNSMTTAILLQGINYQLDEMTQVEQLFSSRDSHRILSRALLVSDPVTAMAWEPLREPLPVVPSAASETVLTCLLRLYAVRRDVTSYYRTIWKPVIPAIIAVLNVDEFKGPHVFGNLLSVANRLLECTLSTRSMIVFPATATAICRAMHEIGGALTMHAYLFNLLILPNLVKVLAGDHESAENECVYPLDKVQAFVDKYFDQSLWFSADVVAEERKSSRFSFNPLRSLIWAVWRLYTHAVYLPSMALTTLTTAIFVGDRLPGVDLSGVPDSKLRNIIARLGRKISRGCEYLLKLPLDAQGSEYLGVDPSVTSGACLPLLTNDHQPEMTKLLDKRLSTLHFKPNEMLNLTVVSKQDVGNLFTDIGVAMELSGQAQGSSLYQGISEYLNHCQDDVNPSVDPDSHDELLRLVFLYDKAAETEELTSQEEIAVRHKQLLRGLTLSNRYEDLLIQLIERAQQRATSTIFDLVGSTDDAGGMASQVNAHPEFDTQFKSDSVRLAQLHTVGSSNKAKQSHFGLNEPHQVTAYPLFSKHASAEHQHPDVKSLAELNNEYFASYRFGSTAPSVAVGTSLARNRVNEPKLKANAVSVTTANLKKPSSTSSQRSRYTKMHIKPDANILVPTESTKSQQSKKTGAPDTLQDKDRHFMKSMRDHKVIPAEEFRQSVEQRRAQHRSDAPRTNLSRVKNDPPDSRSHVPSQRSAQYSSTATTAPIAPQPFPEHLRHRVRGEHEGVGDWQQTSPVRAESPPRLVNSRPNNSKSKASNYTSGNSSKDVIAKIIREYQQVFPGVATPPSRNYQISDLQYGMATGDARRDVSSSADGPVITRTLSRTSSGSRLVHKRAKSPSLPEPIPGASRFSAPTQNLLRKMEVDSGVDIHHNGIHSKTGGNFENLNPRFMQEVHAGIMPGLRSYKSSSDFIAPVFVPTRRRIYASNGARAPRVPDFLVNGTTSRGSSRPSSRTSSPSSRRKPHQNANQNFRMEEEQWSESHRTDYRDEEDDEDYEGEEEEDYAVSDFYSNQYRDDLYPVAGEAHQQLGEGEEYFSDEEQYHDDHHQQQHHHQGSEMDDGYQHRPPQQQYQQQQELQQPKYQQQAQRPNVAAFSVDSPLSFSVDFDNASSKFVLNRQQQQQQLLEKQQLQRQQEQMPMEHARRQMQVPSPPVQQQEQSQRQARVQELESIAHNSLRSASQDSEAPSLSRPAEVAVVREEGRVQIPVPPSRSSLYDHTVRADQHVVKKNIIDFEPAEVFNRERLESDSSRVTTNSQAASVDSHPISAAQIQSIPVVKSPEPTALLQNAHNTETPVVVIAPVTSARSQPMPSTRPVRRNYSAEELYNAQQSPKQAERDAALASNTLPHVSGHVVLGGKPQPPIVRSLPIAHEAPQREQVAPPTPTTPLMASVTPLKFHSSYAINFEESVNIDDEDDQRDTSHIYDTNADREFAAERRRGGLCGSSSDEDSWGEDDGQRCIKDVLKSSRTRFDSTGQERGTGRVPLIKKKSLIPGREDSREFLIKGFQATKHGRSGAPKQKFIVYKQDEGVIEWSASKGRLGGFTSFFSSGGSAAAIKDTTSSISLDAILEVRRGIQTDNFGHHHVIRAFTRYGD
eukprot:gene21721-27774_t